MKKIIILMFAALSIVGLYTTAENRNGMVLTDTQAAIDFMYTNGLTKFSTTQTFMASQSLRRDEAAAFFARFARDVLGIVPDTSKTECNTFTDLSLAHSDLKSEIIASCQLGLFKGSNGKFMPNTSLTNGHALTVLMRLIEGSMSENNGHRAYNYYNNARSLGLTNGLNAYFRDNIDKNITRGDVARLIEAGRQYYGSKSIISTPQSSTNNTDLIDQILNNITQTNNSSKPTCTSQTAPYFTILSPKGGESYKPGDQITIEWESCNLSNMAELGIYLMLEKTNNEGNGTRTHLIENVNNSGEKTITIPVHLGQNMGYIDGEYYKIGIWNQITQPAYSNKIGMNMNFCNGNNVSITWTSYGSGNQYIAEQSSATIGYMDITNHENCIKQITKIETVRRGYGDTEVNTLLNIINNLGFRYIYNDQMHMAFREIGPEGQTYPAIPKKQLILMPNTSLRILMSLQRSQTTSANLKSGVSFKVAPSNIVFEDRNGVKTNLPMNISDIDLPMLITQ